GDAHRLLIDDPAGADVLMPDFAVAHCSFRQPDIKPAGMNQHRRILRHQLVGDRVLREIDGVGVVPLREGIFPPAIADDENEWAFHCLPFVESKDDTDSPQRRRERRDETIILLRALRVSAVNASRPEKTCGQQKTLDDHFPDYYI